jgi:hypothetical protein
MAAFDGSALMFTAFHLLYEHAALSLRTIFAGYAGFTFLLGLFMTSQLNFEPLKREESGSASAFADDPYFPPEKRHRTPESILYASLSGGPGAVSKRSSGAARTSSSSSSKLGAGGGGDLSVPLVSAPGSPSPSPSKPRPEDRDALTDDHSSDSTGWLQYRAALRPPFILVTLFACLFVNVKYFLIGTLNNQYHYILHGDDHRTTNLVSAFNWMLPLSCLSFPIVGPIMSLKSDKWSKDPTDKSKAPHNAKGGIIMLIIMAMCNMILCGSLSVRSPWWVQLGSSGVIVFNRYAFFATVPSILT